MALTEEQAAAATAPDAVDEPVAAGAPATGGLAVWFGTSEHKTIGRLYIGASLLLLALTGVTGALLGAERIDVGTFNVLDGDSVLQVYSLHAVGAVFLFLLPLLLGIAIVVVPLQVGARTLAFPRAAAASFWLWLLASALVLASYAMNGGLLGTDVDGVTLFFAAFAALVAALCLATVCVVTTVLTLRTSGMYLERVPLFSWSMLVGGSIWLLTLPVLFGFTVYGYVAFRYGVSESGDVYDHLRWAWEQPQVWAYAVPALGIVADVVAVMARTRPRRHFVLMSAIGLAGTLGLGAWMAARAEDPEIVEQALFIVVAFAIVLPLLVTAGVLGETIVRGRVRVASPLLFGIAALLMLLAGAGAGALGAITSFDLQFTGDNIDTTWTAGVVHYVLVGTTLASLAALHYWASKLFGRPIAEVPARLAALLALLGTVALALPDLISGALDQGLVLNQSVRDGVEALNAVSLAGGALLAVAAVIVIVTVLGAAVKRGNGDPDPWEGHTLEWLTASPPAPGNFGALPPVHSPSPLLDARDEVERS